MGFSILTFDENHDLIDHKAVQMFAKRLRPLPCSQEVAYSTESTNSPEEILRFIK